MHRTPTRPPLLDSFLFLDHPNDLFIGESRLHLTVLQLGPLKKKSGGDSGDQVKTPAIRLTRLNASFFDSARLLFMTTDTSPLHVIRLLNVERREHAIR